VIPTLEAPYGAASYDERVKYETMVDAATDVTELSAWEDDS
jgi:hypothetical protein